MDNQTYKIKTEKFEGPLDLLLSLIEKRKLLINEISLAQITDDYIGYIKNNGNQTMGESANFILIASTLLLIKSRSLLPNLSLSEEEEQSIDELERRLKIYKEIKELSVHIAERFGKEMIFAPQMRKFDPVFSPDKDTTLPNMLSAMERVLQSLPKKEFLPKAVVKKIISLEEMIGNLTVRIQKSLKIGFKDLAKVGKDDKINVIVSFLAILELVKQGVVSVVQESKHDDIMIESNEVGLPKYGN
ncbi:MAG: ScpA family protein [Candidatus Pacebacteria bacterium]|nr:ScpA family protein [Candidatus Paceibacterota bacterium]MDD5357131.1 ScpA family protein [Candidatus Paceibacterota bacterium]